MIGEKSECIRKTIIILLILQLLVVIIGVIFVDVKVTKLLHKGPESHNNLSAEALFTVYQFSTPHFLAADALEGTFNSSYNPQEIYPSLKDKRKYGFHILPRNKLRVLLVSDPAAQQGINYGCY